ncbi:MAG: type II toxin-antitoxin system RelE/ParE family toxin [Myxococcales bacterium]|nr:type II toxin-antitoxin system RelE/ParE family toxin [Myxococcales bacterium]
MTRLRWSPQAVEDLEAIRAFISRDSQHYAQLVMERIVAAIERLPAFPQMGRVVPELADPEIREVIVDVFRVVYRYRSDCVEVATVFRASRMFPLNRV